jgi:dipeptidyl-peptidase-4
MVVPVTSDDISFLRLQARTQRFTLGTPKEIRITPDGSRVLFLRSGSGTDERHGLWSLDLASGQETRLVDPAALLGDHEELSAEERAARERTRTRAGGVVAYTTDGGYSLAAFSLSGKLFVVDLRAGGAREVPVPGPIMDPRLDPTGRRIAYVASGALHVVDVETGADRVLVDDPDIENVAWGVAEFLAAEEMDRVRGYWWSPSGDHILAARTDRSAVRRWYIADPANPDREANRVAYPAAGTDNVVVTLSVLGVAGGRVDVDWDNAELPYLTSVRWSDGHPPLLAVQTRDQRRMVVLGLDPATGTTEVRQELTDPHWVDIVSGVPALTPEGRLLTVGARDGAYRLFADGTPITPADLQVRAVLDVGPDDVLLTASADDSAQIHVYSVGRTGAAPVRVSTVDGVHSAVRSGDVTVLVSWSMEFAGPAVTVHRDGKPAGEIASLAVSPPLTPNVTLLTAGERNLRCALVLPGGHQPGSRKLPVLLDPYGGPHAQRVLHANNSYLMSQWLADQGFAVLVTDGRGTPGRGPDWDRALAFDVADVTLADQVDALHAVARRYPDLDLGRVAIRGWSFGGFLAAGPGGGRPGQRVG